MGVWVRKRFLNILVRYFKCFKQNIKCVPLRLLIIAPKFKSKLKTGVFAASLLHRSQPQATDVERRLHHIKLLQTCLVDVLLLHYVKLEEKRTQIPLLINLWVYQLMTDKISRVLGKKIGTTFGFWVTPPSYKQAARLPWVYLLWTWPVFSTFSRNFSV